MLNSKIKKASKFTAVLASCICASMLVPEIAMAASGETIGEAAKRLEGNFTDLKSFLVSLGFFVGVVFVLSGLFLLNKEGKQPGQEHGKKGFFALAIGCCLLTLPWIVDTGTTTITGDSSKDNIESDADF